MGGGREGREWEKGMGREGREKGRGCEGGLTIVMDVL